MRQLQRRQHVIDDERRAQARSQAEKQHASSFVTAQRLHGGVIYDLHWRRERGGVVESDPTGGQVVRLHRWLAVDDRTRISDGHPRVLQAVKHLVYFLHHPRRRHRWARRNFDGLRLGHGPHFDVGASNVDDKKDVLARGFSHRQLFYAERNCSVNYRCPVTLSFVLWRPPVADMANRESALRAAPCAGSTQSGNLRPWTSKLAELRPSCGKTHPRLPAALALVMGARAALALERKNLVRASSFPLAPNALIGVPERLEAVVNENSRCPEATG